MMLPEQKREVPRRLKEWRSHFDYEPMWEQDPPTVDEVEEAMTLCTLSAIEQVRRGQGVYRGLCGDELEPVWHHNRRLGTQQRRGPRRAGGAADPGRTGGGDSSTVPGAVGTTNDPGGG